MRDLRRLLFLVVPLFTFERNGAAHEVPSDAAVHAFVKPSGATLQLLVRVPLRTIRDVDFPEIERGYLDVEKLAPLLPDAATLWISDFIFIYEGGEKLPKPRLVSTQLSIESDKSFASFEVSV